MKLVKGVGSPAEGGCWMVAASMYAHGKWSDQPACVPPTIRALCVRLNDMCSDGEREALIGPHLFAPMGRDASPEAEQRRAWLCAEWAVRRYALPCDATRTWAERWLSGENRSREAARAAWEAGAAWEAARATARATERALHLADFRALEGEEGE